MKMIKVATFLLLMVVMFSCSQSKINFADNKLQELNPSDTARVDEAIRLLISKDALLDLSKQEVSDINYFSEEDIKRIVLSASECLDLSFPSGESVANCALSFIKADRDKHLSELRYSIDKVYYEMQFQYFKFDISDDSKLRMLVLREIVEPIILERTSLKKQEISYEQLYNIIVEASKEKVETKLKVTRLYEVSKDLVHLRGSIMDSTVLEKIIGENSGNEAPYIKCVESYYNKDGSLVVEQVSVAETKDQLSKCNDARCEETEYSTDTYKEALSIFKHKGFEKELEMVNEQMEKNAEAFYEKVKYHIVVVKCLKPDVEKYFEAIREVL